MAVPPGEYLAEVLQIRGMSQAELARRIGRPVQAINEIIKGTKALTPETALQLERALNVPGHIWLGLESRFRLILARNKETKLIRKELPHLSNRVYKQLADMGCVKGARDGEHKIRELHRFYGVSALGNLSKARDYEAVFRGKGKPDPSSFALAAWLRCASLRAAEIPTEAFDKAKLKAALDEVKTMTGKPLEGAFTSNLRKVMSRCGVALVLLPEFPSVCADGATFWLRANKAVLLMRCGLRSRDDFRHGLFHAAGHLLLHKKTMFIEDKLKVRRHASLEKEAEDFALSMIPG